ncbi:ABC transporter permease subunit [Bacillus sp. AK031]
MRYIRDVVMVFAGMFLIGCLPSLFYGGLGFRYIIEVLAPSGEGIGFYPLSYLASLKKEFLVFLQPELWQINATFGRSYTFFEMMEGRYSYTMKVFLLALAAALLITLVFTIIHSLLPAKMKKGFSVIVDILEALPDVFIIVGLQLLVIIILRRTGTLVAEIAMLNEEIYLLPVLCLTIVPSVFLVKTAILLLREEEGKQYVDLARGKGLNRIYILFVHSLRNALYSLFYRSKVIFAFMLSNLFIIERLFNMKGLMDLLIWSSGYSFVLITMSVFLPFYMVFSLSEFYLLKKTGQGKEEELYV